MKHLIKNYLINMWAIWASAQIIPALVINGGFRGLATGALAFMVMNVVLVPLIKILLLPLNILTLGVFAWLSNVLALYFLVSVIPTFKVMPYNFPGLDINGFIVPEISLSTFQVVIVVSFIIGFIIHFTNWLEK